MSRRNGKISKLTVITALVVIILCFIVSAGIVSQTAGTPTLKEEQGLYYDTPSTDLVKFFHQPKQEYHIRYDHVGTDTIIVPDSCVIYFEGGSIAAPIKFHNSRLAGLVKLKGSSIEGSVMNEVFNASWLCNMDGKTDDAKNINQMIEVSNNLFFPSGEYYFESIATPSSDIPKSLYKQVMCHIGLHKSNISLLGQPNTRFISASPIAMICVYSCPNQIENSISNLLVDNITFVEKNDKEHFHEFAHTIKLIGVNGCTITNCRFDDFWGDAITLSHYGDDPSTGERTRNQNIKIINNYIIGKSHNNRNAISVVSGKNISILNNTISEVSKGNMPGAIDIEANNTAYTLENITIAYNKIDGSNGMGGAIGVVSLRNSPAHRIIIDNNTISNSSAGIAFGIYSDDCVSDITVTSNIIDSNIRGFRFGGKSRTKNWIVRDNITSYDMRNFGGNLKIQDIQLK